jgi:hypothetical protein
MANQREGGSEWESIKILLEGDRGSNKMSTTSNTCLRLNYPSWSRPRSHWSATDPRNRQTTFRAKTHQHTQQKLTRLAACATPVRPMPCTGQTGDTGQTGGQSRSDRCPAPVRPVTPVRLVDRAGQAGGYSRHTTNIPESLYDFSRPWNKNTHKTQLARKKNPSQNQAKHLQTRQKQISTNTTQRHTSPANHPRQIPQRAHTGQTGQEHRSDRWCLGSSR